MKLNLSRTWQNSGMTCGVPKVSLKMLKCDQTSIIVPYRELNRRNQYVRHEKMVRVAVDDRSRDVWKRVDRMDNYQGDSPSIDGPPGHNKPI